MKKLLSFILIIGLFVSIIITPSALTKFDFAQSLASGNWKNSDGTPLTVQENTLVLPMASTETGFTFFYDDPNIGDIDLEFDMKIALDTKLNKAGTLMDWDVTTAWCFLLAVRDTYWEVPYWNPSETGSYTIMYHPRSGESLAHWASSNRASKKGEVQWSTTPDLADGKWHTFRVAIEDVVGKTDKMKVIIAVDGNEYSNYEANKTSSKGYISFYNQSCSMQLRKSTSIKTTVSSISISSNSASASKSIPITSSGIVSNSIGEENSSLSKISGESQDGLSSIVNSEDNKSSFISSNDYNNSGSSSNNDYPVNNNSIWIIIVIAVVVLIGGGITFYLLKFKKK